MCSRVLLMLSLLLCLLLPLLPPMLRLQRLGRALEAAEEEMDAAMARQTGGCVQRVCAGVTPLVEEWCVPHMRSSHSHCVPQNMPLPSWTQLLYLSVWMTPDTADNGTLPFPVPACTCAH